MRHSWCLIAMIVVVMVGIALWGCNQDKGNPCGLRVSRRPPDWECESEHGPVERRQSCGYRRIHRNGRPSSRSTGGNKRQPTPNEPQKPCARARQWGLHICAEHTGEQRQGVFASGGCSARTLSEPHGSPSSDRLLPFDSVRQGLQPCWLGRICCDGL